MAIIRSFRELDVYALVREQAKRIFVISKGFPKEEKFSLTDQIRRSSRAVNAMIAEAGLDEDTELHLSTKSTRR
jgi:four helix bundle protein